MANDTGDLEASIWEVAYIDPVNLWHTTLNI
jgi:hypothetical protein